jgi:alkyl hydroperoxide reductase subunit AhpC
MALQIGDIAPDFEAQTTEGKIRFHDWIGSSWAVLFSHPKDFTPICTTELGYMAKIKPEFDKRGVKIIGLSVDPVDNHAKWANDIKETQGFAPNYPMIGDTDFNVSKLYGMLPASTSGDPTKRTAADNQTVRNVFVIGPDKKIKLIPGLSNDHGPQFRRGAARDRLASADRQAQSGDAGELEAGRGCDHRRLGDRRRSQEDLSGRLEVTKAVHPDRAAAAVAKIASGD